MAKEIELKARVRDTETLRRLLAEKADYLYSFEKEDCYWFPSANPRTDIPPSPLYRSGLRIRTEKRLFPDGRVETSAAATWKTKKVRDGVEINDEREFAVEPRAEFEEFLALAGLKPEAAKQKRGWAYSKGGITAELLEVPGLGWFLELEIVIDDKTPGDAIDVPAGNLAARAGDGNAHRGIGGAEEILTVAGKRLMDFLRALGIAETDIESRFYSEMLKERESRNAPR